MSLAPFLEQAEKLINYTNSTRRFSAKNASISHFHPNWAVLLAKLVLPTALLLTHFAQTELWRRHIYYSWARQTKPALMLQLCFGSPPRPFSGPGLQESWCSVSFLSLKARSIPFAGLLPSTAALPLYCSWVSVFSNILVKIMCA